MTAIVDVARITSNLNKANRSILTHVCPSSQNGARLGVKGAVCADCTSCWDRPDVVTLYPAHGYKVKGHHVARAKDGSNLKRVQVSAHTIRGVVTVTVSYGNKSLTGTVDLAPVDLALNVQNPKLPGSRTALFSHPSKMKVLHGGKLVKIPTFNMTALFSPAAGTVTCPAANLLGSCAYCYARQGNYAWLNTILATELRTLWFLHHAEHNHDYLVRNMAYAIIRATIGSKSGINRFRWFDAGDVSNVHVARAIRAITMLMYKIARRDYGTIVKGWLPTHSAHDGTDETAHVADIMAHLVGLARYGLTVRPSERHSGTAVTLAARYRAIGLAAPTGVAFAP